MVGKLRQPRLSKFDHLERAAVFPERRAAELEKALLIAAGELPAAGTALLRPRTGEKGPLEVSYAGESRREIRRWLDSYYEAAREGDIPVLSGGATGFPGAEPVCLPLEPGAHLPRAWWLIWPYEDVKLTLSSDEVEPFRAALEAFVEVEHKEQLYFRSPENPLDRDLAQALREGDEHALPALLAFARTVGGADIAYWGDVHDDVVDVGWHLGAEDHGFGFRLPIGQGVGGRAFARDTPLLVPDYRNCQYRYPGVSDVTDSEKVRSVLAIPVHNADQRKGAILYAVRRKVDAFAPAERIMLRRLARNIEPVPGLGPPPKRFFASGGDHLRELKSGLRRIMLSSEEVTDIEAWAGDLIRGPAILADGRGRPYAAKNGDRLDRLFSPFGEQRRPRTVLLQDPDTRADRGALYLWPSIDLPPAGWPDFLDDVAAACNIVVDRAEESHDHLNRQRARWLGSLQEGRFDARLRREGNRLGLPTDRGEVWAVAWKEEEPSGGQEQTRRRMLAEDVALDSLDSPLVFLEDDLAVLLLKERGRTEPSGVRDGLLKVLGPCPLWLVHGAGYDSFEGLGDALLQTTRAARRVRREASESYVLEVGGGGLDGLLENPRLSEGLSSFADSLLGPVMTYDEENGTQLAETLCLTLTSGSTQEVARRLFVHANTVRYRARRAEQILGRDLTLPKEKAAASLAAFVWLHRRAAPFN